MITRPIKRFTSGTFTITRTTELPPVDGYAVAGVVSTLPAELSIQPMTGREVVVLPEATHATDVRKAWTVTELFTKRPGYEADSFLIGSERYEVFHVETWPRHFLAYAARQRKP